MISPCTFFLSFCCPTMLTMSLSWARLLGCNYPLDMRFLMWSSLSNKIVTSPLRPAQVYVHRNFFFLFWRNTICMVWILIRLKSSSLTLWHNCSTRCPNIKIVLMLYESGPFLYVVSSCSISCRYVLVIHFFAQPGLVNTCLNDDV